MRTWLAAAASVGVHAAVFGAFVGRTPEAAPVAVAGPKPVEVEVFRLAAVVPRAAPAAVPAAEPRKPRELPEPFDRRRTGSDASHRSRGPARPEPAVAPATPVEADEETSDATPPDSARGTLAPPDAPAAPPAPTLDTTELSRRLQAVAARCYPAAARRFRQTGEAEVRFCLDAEGTLAESTVSRSSGSDLLDRAASGCVVPGAAPFGTAAHGRCFTVPVRFRQ